MPQNGGGIPKTVKIGDVEYNTADHPELLALVEAGRKDEKGKLYSQISTLTAEIQTLKDSKTSIEELSKKDQEALKKLQDELAVAKNALEKVEKQDPPKGGEGAKGGLTQAEIDKQIQDALDKQKTEFEKKYAEIKGDLNSKSIADYRKELLAQNKGIIIEALVPENLDSKEAVNKAIESALKTSKEYIRKDYTDKDGKTSQLTLAEIEAIELKAKEEEDAKRKAPIYVPAGGNPPTPPPNGGGGLDSKVSVKDLKGMSQAEFEKNREALRQEILKVGYGEE